MGSDMKILRMRLCYPKGDKIIVDREDHLERFDLSKLEGIEVEAQMSIPEFNTFRSSTQQIITTESSNVNISVLPERREKRD